MTARWGAAALAVAGRELLATVRSPVAWVVGAAFLALEGLTFAATVRVLADPTRPGDYGAVLRGQFATSVLGWLVLFAVVAAVTMRLVAEERRQGTWETLVTAPVAEGAVLAGKWLAAWLFLVALWLPTLVYPAIVAGFAPPGAALDVGPVAAAYLGIALVIAAATAIGLLASAAGTSQVIASVLGFGALVGLLLVGELDEALPGVFAGDGPAARLVGWIDLRRRMDDFARGAVDLGAIVLFASLAAVAGVAAHAAAALGRFRAAHGRRRLLVAGLVALDALLLNLYVARHDVRWDLSAADLNRLDEATRELVAGLDRPLAVTVVRPAVAAFEPVYVEVDRLIERLGEAAPSLARRDLDAAVDAEAVAALADASGAPPRDLADGGAVVLELDGRRRVVELLDMASFGEDALAVGAIERLAVEQAIASALAELVHGEPPRVCFTVGHGELPLRSGDRAGLDRLREALVADAMAVEELAGVAVPPACRVVVVAAPEEPVPAGLALAIEAHLGRGGGLLVMARRAGSTGLELILARAGLVVAPTVVDDRERAVELPGAFGVTEGYGDHPVTRPFQGRRMTVWQAPREVARAAGGGAEVEVLVAAGAGEGAALVAASRDAATGARVAAIGGGAALAGALADGVPANVELGRRLIGWLAGQEPVVLAPAKTPEHLRLVMTSSQLRAVFVLCALALPALCLGIGALVAWRRRRG